MSMSSTREPAFSVTSDDLVFQTFRAGGNGGQNQNKRDTGVRVIHPPSGARAESREQRSQLQNKRAALRRMADTPAFRFWVQQELRRLDGRKTVEQKVDEAMASENLLVERRDAEGNWTPWSDSATRD